MFHVLINSPLFRGLEIEEIEALMQKTSHQIRQFVNKELLASSGERVDKAIILLEGRLQGEMVDFSGNSLKIEELDPPQMVAAAFLYGPLSVFPVNLSAKSEGKILIIFKSDFTNMLSKDPRVLNNYLNIVSSKAQFLSGKITFLNFKTIKEKIAFFLLQKMKKESPIVIINQTQKGLAELFGVARPSLARSINEMEENGILKWERDQVLVLDPKRLNLILGR